MFCGTDVLALEVSQKSILALPCCMGLIIFCDPHPAWERDFHTWWHLPSEKAIFFIFSTPLTREAQKSTKSHLEAMVWTRRRRRRKKQNDTKSSPTPLDFDRDAFFESFKIWQIDSRMCVFPKEYQQLQLQRPSVCFTNFIKFHQICWKRYRISTIHISRFFCKLCMNIIAGKMTRSSDRFQSTLPTARKTIQELNICMVDPDPECGVLMW